MRSHPATRFARAMRDGGEIMQLVQLADLIEECDPEHPESLETSALVHFKANNPKRALRLIDRAIANARVFGTEISLMDTTRRLADNINRRRANRERMQRKPILDQLRTYSCRYYRPVCDERNLISAIHHAGLQLHASACY